VEHHRGLDPSGMEITGHRSWPPIVGGSSLASQEFNGFTNGRKIPAVAVDEDESGSPIG
jgi:hypothetical protein